MDSEFPSLSKREISEMEGVALDDHAEDLLKQLSAAESPSEINDTLGRMLQFLTDNGDRLSQYYQEQFTTILDSVFLN